MTLLLDYEYVLLPYWSDEGYYMLVLQCHLAEKSGRLLQEGKQMTTSKREAEQKEQEEELVQQIAEELAHIQSRIGPRFRRSRK